MKNQIFELVVVTDEQEKSRVCREVLEGLPEWFGIPEATEDYIKNAQHQMMVVAYQTKTLDAMGFATTLLHNANAAEIAVMGVLENHHRKGIGRELVAHLEGHLKKEGIRFVTVKTLAAAHPSPEYQRTRLFYEGYGFTELEVLSDLWGADNPCAYMVKLVE